MFSIASEKLSVLLHPGGPTIISGIFASMHTTVQNRFSRNDSVAAMPFLYSVFRYSRSATKRKISRNGSLLSLLLPPPPLFPSPSLPAWSPFSV